MLGCANGFDAGSVADAVAVGFGGRGSGLSAGGNRKRGGGEQNSTDHMFFPIFQEVGRLLDPTRFRQPEWLSRRGERREHRLAITRELGFANAIHPASSVRLAGRVAAISRSVESWNTT